jgi:hypothetical protein
MATALIAAVMDRLKDKKTGDIIEMCDNYERFKEFVQTMHHLMATGHAEMDDDEFTVAVGNALKKADPDYYK